MRNRRRGISETKQLLRQFYEIQQQASNSQQIFPPTAMSMQNYSKQIQQSSKKQKKTLQQQEQQQQQQQEEEDYDYKGKLMQTSSTQQIAQSKIKLWDNEYQCLREIQEKSQRQENQHSSYNSLEKYNLKQRSLEKSQANTKNLNKQDSKQRQKQRPKPKKNPNSSSFSNSKSSKDLDQMIISLKYEHDCSKSKTYRIGMKILNREWFKVLDDLHRDKGKQQEKKNGRTKKSNMS